MIRDVWASNLEEELRIISSLIDDYPFVAMDTEFPGVIVKPTDSFKSFQELEYQSMRCNVDFLRIIQIGITLGDKDGNVPEPCGIWQFNFKFNDKKDTFSSKSMQILQNSQIDFDKFNTCGIDVYDFARLCIPSGLVMNPAITWITFHGISDFGYFIKILTAKPLPKDHESFLKLLEIYFPNYYDIKYYTYPRSEIERGLQKIAAQLDVTRVGMEHQAGSDSYVTLKIFREVNEKFFTTEHVLNAKNKLYGLSLM